jgi:hypothetical protein
MKSRPERKAYETMPPESGLSWRADKSLMCEDAFILIMCVTNEFWGLD